MTATGRVLVTGATGLLGRAVTAALKAAGRATLAVGHRSEEPDVLRLDLREAAALSRLDAEPWTAAVHCAAYRSPDFCEEQPREAARLNAEAAGRLAALAQGRGARLIHISTDYVFDGTLPPYKEDDPTGPVNEYGRSKLAGERHVLAACPPATVLRVVALYGEPPPPAVSPMLEEGLQAALCSETCALDDRTVRFPTHADDIAAVILFLLDRPFSGPLHAAAGDATTRFGWAVAIARCLGKDASHLVPRDGPPAGKAPRPLNSHLSTERLAALGAPVPRGFRERLPGVLRRRLSRGA